MRALRRRSHRAGGLLAAGTLAAGAALAVSVSEVPSAQAGGHPARMLVYAQEWSLWPSRTVLPAGATIVQLVNRGQDPHDLRIRRLGARGRMTGRAQALPTTASGALTEGRWRLSPGRYELYCALPGHLRAGMHATLSVR